MDVDKKRFHIMYKLPALELPTGKTIEGDTMEETIAVLREEEPNAEIMLVYQADVDGRIKY